MGMRLIKVARGRVGEKREWLWNMVVWLLEAYEVVQDALR